MPQSCPVEAVRFVFADISTGSNMAQQALWVLSGILEPQTLLVAEMKKHGVRHRGKKDIE